jgi:hypothetical protein
MSAEPQPFPRALIGYLLALSAASLGLVVVSIVTQGPPRALPLVALLVMALVGANRIVVVPGKDISFSPVTLVVMTAVVVFAHERSLAGVVLVGLASWVSLSALKHSRWQWILLSGAILGCSAAFGMLAYALFGDIASRPMPIGLLALIPTALCFVAANWLLVLLSYVVELRHVPRRYLVSLPSHLVGEIPFALVGLVVGGLFVSYGPAVMLLIIVPILIAREMFASYVRVKESHEETVGMLIRALEAKDRYTSGHSERVATYARYMGEELKFMPSRLERLRFAALMHDIGKLVVPNHLLNKPGRLTEEEFAQVRIHEKVSVQMLSHIDFLRPIAAASHSDATRFDPDDEDHPIEPYIVMIADAYDAMTSTRSYRKALTQEVAFGELRDKAGVQFHPACVEALITAIETRGEKHGAGYEVQDEFDDAPESGLGSAGLGDLIPSDSSS